VSVEEFYATKIKRHANHASSSIAVIQYWRLKEEASLAIKAKVKLHVLTLQAILLVPLSSSAQLVCQSSTPTSKNLNAELRYRLLDYFQPVRFCDPDCIGPCRLDLKKRNAQQIVVQLRQDNKTFRAISHRVGLKAEDQFSEEQKLTLYREYKRLSCGIDLRAEGEQYRFDIASANGFRVEGLINNRGDISVLKKKRSTLYCPK